MQYYDIQHSNTQHHNIKHNKKYSANLSIMMTLTEMS